MNSTCKSTILARNVRAISPLVPVGVYWEGSLLLSFEKMVEGSRVTAMDETYKNHNPNPEPIRFTQPLVVKYRSIIVASRCLVHGVCQPFSRINVVLTLIELQSRFGDKPVKSQAVCPPKWDCGTKRDKLLLGAGANSSSSATMFEKMIR